MELGVGDGPLLRRRHGGLDRALRPGRGPHRRGAAGGRHHPRGCGRLPGRFWPIWPSAIGHKKHRMWGPLEMAPTSCGAPGGRDRCFLPVSPSIESRPDAAASQLEPLRRLLDRWCDSGVVMTMIQCQSHDVGEHGLFNHQQRASRPPQPPILRGHDLLLNAIIETPFGGILLDHRRFRTSAAAGALAGARLVGPVGVCRRPCMTKLHDIPLRVRQSVVRPDASARSEARLDFGDPSFLGVTILVSANEALVRRAVDTIWNRGDPCVDVVSKNPVQRL